MVNDILLQVGAYAAVLLMGFLLFNWLSGGTLTKMMKVKMSRGRKLLVRVRGVQGDHFLVGEIFEGFLVYKDRSGNNRRIVFNDRAFIVRAMGVGTVDVDDEKNAIVKPDFTTVSGFDAVKYDNLLTRALMAANPIDNKILIIIVLSALTLLAVIIVGILVFKLTGQVHALNQVTTATTTAATI